MYNINIHPHIIVSKLIFNVAGNKLLLKLTNLIQCVPNDEIVYEAKQTDQFGDPYQSEVAS